MGGRFREEAPFAALWVPGAVNGAGSNGCCGGCLAFVLPPAAAECAGPLFHEVEYPRLPFPPPLALGLAGPPWS